MNINSLEKLFGNNQIKFMVDCHDVASWFSDKGLETVFYTDTNLLSVAIVSIQTTIEHFNIIGEIAKSKKSQILTIPQVAFDTSLKTVLYSCEQLLNTNFEAAFNLQKKVMEKLIHSTNPIILKNQNFQIKCKFSESTNYAYPKDLSLPYNMPRSIAEYLELHFENIEENSNPLFCLDGQIKTAAFLYAIHPSKKNIFDKETLEKANYLLETISNCHSAILRFKDNYADSFIIDGKENIDIISTLAGKQQGLKITEFAFGLNNTLQRQAQWGLNAQINEGAAGIHVGIGDGSTGVHMDFICPDVNFLSFF